LSALGRCLCPRGGPGLPPPGLKSPLPPLLPLPPLHPRPLNSPPQKNEKTPPLRSPPPGPLPRCFQNGWPPTVRPCWLSGKAGPPRPFFLMSRGPPGPGGRPPACGTTAQTGTCRRSLRPPCRPEKQPDLPLGRKDGAGVQVMRCVTWATGLRPAPSARFHPGPATRPALNRLGPMASRENRSRAAVAASAPPAHPPPGVGRRRPPLSPCSLAPPRVSKNQWAPSGILGGQSPGPSASVLKPFPRRPFVGTKNAPSRARSFFVEPPGGQSPQGVLFASSPGGPAGV